MYLIFLRTRTPRHAWLRKKKKKRKKRMLPRLPVLVLLLSFASLLPPSLASQSLVTSRNTTITAHLSASGILSIEWSGGDGLPHLLAEKYDRGLAFRGAWEPTVHLVGFDADGKDVASGRLDSLIYWCASQPIPRHTLARRDNGTGLVMDLSDWRMGVDGEGGARVVAVEARVTISFHGEVVSNRVAPSMGSSCQVARYGFGMVCRPFSRASPLMLPAPPPSLVERVVLLFSEMWGG